MRVALVSAFFPPAHLAGGPVQTLGAMVTASPGDVNIDVLTSDGDLGLPSSLAVPIASWTSWEGACVYYVPRGWIPLLRGYATLARRRPDYVYTNSFFGFKYSVVPQCLARLGVFGRAQVVVAPRGELNRGALRLKARKKWVFLRVYRAIGLGSRTVWHASTELEASDVRREIDASAQILVRSNDALLPKYAPRRRARTDGPCRLIFASRLSEKKRLDLLLMALQMVEGDFTLKVLGAFESSSYAKRCLALASTDRLKDRVDFLGPGSRDDVLREFAAADAFVFPTAGENFGHVIAESLSVSCPVIVSAHTPWGPYLTPGGGAVVSEDTAEGFAAVIEHFVRLGPIGWLKASQSAATGFERWVSETSQAHLFDLLRSWKAS